VARNWVSLGEKAVSSPGDGKIRNLQKKQPDIMTEIAHREESREFCLQKRQLVDGNLWGREACRGKGLRKARAGGKGGV